MRPALYPVSSPAVQSRANLQRYWMERTLARGVPELHPAVQAKAGRIHGIRHTAVPQKGSTTPASVAWHRVTTAQPGYMNRRMRRFLERDNDARMEHLARSFG